MEETMTTVGEIKSEMLKKIGSKIKASDLEYITDELLEKHKREGNEL
jgi:hypothetical protein